MQLELVDQRTRQAELPLALPVLQDLVSSLGGEHWLLNLVLVDDPQMAELNQRWYGGQGPTDVLSFSYLESEGPGDPDLEQSRGGAAHDLWCDPGGGDQPVVVGEVILAPEFVAGRCAREGWDLADEWGLLLVHGSLHVLGWTHDDSDQRQIMQGQEVAVLQAHGRRHPLADPDGGGS